jgi:LytS/YehU family sensor histidine kinase
VQKLQKIIRQLFESKIEIHVVFIIFFLVLFFLPPLINNLSADKIFHVVIYAFFLLACIYTGRWCSRRWLLKNKFFKFFFYMPASLILLAFIGIINMKMLVNNNVLSMIITVLFFVLLFFFLGLFLSVTRNTVLRQINEAKTLQQQKEVELELLRSQLSPHFLFNTLNNLYGLSITQHQKMPGLLLKLSDLLRYTVYESREDFVSLKNEVNYIENYIELEKIRIGERLLYKANIDKANLESNQIAPLLLITFVENAFKHSKQTCDQSIEVRIILSVINDILYFAIKNSYMDETEKLDGFNKQGIGMSTTLKRLELLYPQKYILNTKKVNGYYEVKLQLNLK